MNQYRAQAPDKEKFARLFEPTGWNEEYRQISEEPQRAIRNSWYALSALDGEQLVGFGRLVTDEVSHAMIYDLIVGEAYRRQGIGTEILAQLVRKCLDAGIRDIQLFCAKGKWPFYEKRGFVARPDDAPGMAFHPIV